MRFPLRPITVTFLLLVFLSQYFSRYIILADYELNKDYISRVLCENRNKPNLHCNGKCQLKKRLEKDQKEAQSPFNFLKTKLDLFRISANMGIQTISDQGPTYAAYPFINEIRSPFMNAPFHPPC